MNLDILTLVESAELIPVLLGQDPKTGITHLLAYACIHTPTDYTLDRGVLVQGTTFNSLRDGLNHFKGYDTEVRDVVFG